MRYVTFSTRDNSVPRLGVMDGDRIVDVQSITPAGGSERLPTTLVELIRGGPASWRRVADTIEAGRRNAKSFPANEIRWHAPIPRPDKNVFCVGRNYVGHVEEALRAAGKPVKIPEVPMFFTKAPTAVNGPYDDVPAHTAFTSQTDWEAELGLVIGVAGRDIAPARARDHVFGYTVMNDVTARDLQNRHGQFFKGKSLDGSCPMGPCVVTADEFGDPHAKRVTLRVNGVVKQDGNTRNMIFPIETLIESLSQALTLEPGDLIATGTPDGVGFARTPPEFLHDGDIMETEVEGIGTMRNRIVATGA